MSRVRPLLLVVAVLALPACGSGGLSLPATFGGGVPTEIDAPATVFAEVDGTTPSDDVRPGIDEAVDPATYQAHLDAAMADVTRMRMVTETTIEGATLSTVVVTDASGDEPRMQTTTTTPDGELVIRLVGTRAWARGTGLADASTWVRVDPSDPGDPLAARVAPILDALARGEAATAALAPDIDSVTYLGADTVDGIDAVLDHYRLEVDTASMGAMMGAGPDETDQVVAVAGDTTIIETWLDSSGRGRRTAGSFAGIDTVTTVDRFGADFGLVVPDPDRVLTMDQALQQAPAEG